MAYWYFYGPTDALILNRIYLLIQDELLSHLKEPNTNWSFYNFKNNFHNPRMLYNWT